MNVQNIFDFLNKTYPFSLAEKWDNPGLLVGNGKAEVTKAVVALDCSLAVLAVAKDLGSELIITHHPVIFEPLHTLLSDSIPWQAAQSGISVISAHTNLDVAAGGVNDCLCSCLGLIDVKTLSFGRIGTLGIALSSEALVKSVKSALKLSFVNGYFSGNPVKTVAVCSGSGGDMLHDSAAAGADALITADIKYSKFIEAEQLGITLIDAGHFNTKDVVIEPLSKKLSENITSVSFYPIHLSPIKQL